MNKNKSFVVLGLGRFGQSLAKTLYEMGHEVLAIDENEEIVQAISMQVTHAVQGDCLDENVLSSIGVRNFDIAVVSIGQDMQSSILTTVMLKEMGVKYVVAKAQSELHSRVLEKVGADRVVFPERDMGVRVAHTLSAANFVDFLELSPTFSIAEISPLSKWVGKSIAEVDIRAAYGVNVVAIKNDTGINVNPSATDVIKTGDILVVIGSNNDLNRIK